MSPLVQCQVDWNEGILGGIFVGRLAVLMSLAPSVFSDCHSIQHRVLGFRTGVSDKVSHCAEPPQPVPQASHLLLLILSLLPVLEMIRSRGTLEERA